MVPGTGHRVAPAVASAPRGPPFSWRRVTGSRRSRPPPCWKSASPSESRFRKIPPRCEVGRGRRLRSCTGSRSSRSRPGLLSRLGRWRLLRLSSCCRPTCCRFTHSGKVTQEQGPQPRLAAQRPHFSPSYSRCARLSS